MSINSFDDNYNKTNPYPVGSVYISINSTEPSILFGGVWQRIEGRFLLACSDSHPQGETGGAEQVTLTLSQAPSHTHTRGTMEISGTATFTAGGESQCWGGGSGAFESLPIYGHGFFNIGGGGNLGADPKIRGWDFTASRNWTGETSSQGGNQPHENMPPYLSVYMWYRVS